MKHQLEYSIYSRRVSWCPICLKHFYNERNVEHTTRATENHYHETESTPNNGRERRPVRTSVKIGRSAREDGRHALPGWLRLPLYFKIIGEKGRKCSRLWMILEEAFF
jgi:hypothetical protein